MEFPDEEPEEYKIVGSTEANCLNGKISNESPVGIALIGSKVGDVVTVESNTGDIIKYEELEIQRAEMEFRKGETKQWQSSRRSLRDSRM